MTDDEEQKLIDHYLSEAESVPEDDFDRGTLLSGILNANLAIALMLRQVLKRISERSFVLCPEGHPCNSDDICCVRCGRDITP